MDKTNQSLSSDAFGTEEYECLFHVFGGIEPDGKCSYKKGYVKRQAIYVCKTCSTSTPAAVCFNCIGICHEGHEFEELHTKRLFRCDCGNEKFVTPCLLEETKDDTNAKNQYNHNFTGQYCSCNSEENETMYQCNLCEDWFHEDCFFSSSNPFLECKEDLDENELTCKKCMEGAPFLQHYAKWLTVSYPSNKSSDQAKCSNELIKLVEDVVEMESIPCPNSQEHQSSIAKRPRLDCDLGTQVWLGGWRKKLCQCSNCLDMYKDHNLLFLLDEEDTLDFYDKLAVKRVKQMEENAIKDLLEDPDVVTRHTYAYALGKLTTVIGDFCKKMNDAGKVTNENPITDEDVKEFFNNLDSEGST